MSNFDLSDLALKAICPNNALLFDDVGMPSVMVRVPKMTYADLGLGESTDVFPAFIVNGQEVPEIYISKYQNVVQGSRAYSLPGRDPKSGITLNAAISACSAKGTGWHLMTRMEWALLAHWCKHNNCMPLGNNNNGKDVSESSRDHAIPATFGTGADAGKVFHVLTGTGPLTWSHDRTLAGIWDLNGNVGEWIGGLRTVYGELQVLANNNAADSSKSQAEDSSEWKAINATTGALVTPGGSGTTVDSIKMRWKNNSHWEWTTDSTADGTDTYKGCGLESVVADSSIDDPGKLILQALGLLKYDDTPGAYGGYLSGNSSASERSFYCGGHYSTGANAGVFSALGISARSNSYGNIGFRSAFVNLPTA